MSTVAETVPRGQSYEEVYRQLRDEAPAKLDMVLNTREHVSLRIEEGRLLADFNPDSFALENRAMDITDFAHTQIAARSGIPAAYYRRMQENQPELLLDNVHTWWRKEPENRLVRTTSLGVPRVRAWLSDRYRVLDNEEFLVSVLEQAEIHNATIKSCHLDDERLYVKLLSPRQAEVKRGDIIQSGIVVRNSEVGDGRVIVQPFIYRLACKNGSITTERYARTHLGGQLEPGILEDDTLEAEEKLVWLQVRDWVRAAFSEVHLDRAAELFRQAQESSVPVQAQLAVANVIRKNGLSPKEGQGVLERFLRNDDDTQFGLVNAVTQFAHESEPSYRRQVELEQLGGALLERTKPAFVRLVSSPLSEKDLARALYGKVSLN